MEKVLGAGSNSDKQKSQIAGKEKALLGVCTTYYYVRKWNLGDD